MQKIRVFFQNSSLYWPDCCLGLSLVLAFAPFHFSYLTPLPLFCLIHRARCDSPRASLTRGWWFGLGFFLASVSWVYVSMHTYGQTPWPIAGLLTVIFCSFLAIFPAITLGLSRYLGLWSFAPLWVLSEWLRATLLTGFPWMLLGYSQADNYFGALAPIIGVYGLSGLITLLASLPIRASLIVLLMSVAASFSAQQVMWTKPLGKPISVALVQGNIAQQVKWDDGALENIIQTYTKASAKHWQQDLVIWPESAIPLVWPLAKEILPKPQGGTFITGLPILDEQGRYFNAIMAFNTKTTEYRKAYLVPFGEFVPLAGLIRQLGGVFNLPMSDFSAGPPTQQLLKHNNINIAPFICYEIAYNKAVATQAPNSHLLLTINNDAWFGNSLAPYQHLQIAQFRSRQTAKPQLFLSNDGITATINPKGQIESKLPQFKTAVLSTNTQPTQGTTLWEQFPDWPTLLISLLTLLIIFSTKLCTRRKP